MSRLNPVFPTRAKAALLLADAVILVAVFALVVWIRFAGGQSFDLVDPAFLAAAFALIVSLYILGAYDLDGDVGRGPLIARVAAGFLVAASFGLIVGFLLRIESSGLFGRGIFLGGLALSFLISSILRLALLSRVRKALRRQNWLLLTTSERAQGFAEDLRKNQLAGVLEVVALDGSGVDARIPTLLAAPRSGIILAAPESQWEKFGAQLVDARLQGVPVTSLSAVFEQLWKRIPVHHLDHRWFLQPEGFGLVNSPPKQRVKRLMDLAAAMLLLLLTWPFMLLTALAVKLESKGPALYRQTRTGRGGEDFTILKFRSMRTDAEKNGAVWAKAQDDRVTRVGRFIRKSRLDELPQLINVIRGEMSFVGPRPERPEFNSSLAKEIPFYNLRHLVRPGLTGWAQVSYPYGASVEDAARKLEYDLYYIKNFSPWMDIRIILKTVGTVLFARGR